MAVTLTEKAAKHVANYHAPSAARASACASACAPPAVPAWPTSWSSPTRPSPRTCVFESHGVKVLSIRRACPTSTAPSSTIAREGLNEGFKFNNPNVKDQCGCGESFNV